MLVRLAFALLILILGGFVMADVDVHDYGAKGDGVADDTASIQAALNAAAKSGPICLAPPGMYRLDGSLTVPPGVTLNTVPSLR